MRGRNGRRGREAGRARDTGYEGSRDGHGRGRRGAGFIDVSTGDRYDGYDRPGDGRLDDFGDFGGNVKFKGRGSMKYREKKW